jgi:DNA-binding transcriptional regulator YiaG
MALSTRQAIGSQSGLNSDENSYLVRSMALSESCSYGSSMANSTAERLARLRALLASGEAQRIRQQHYLSLNEIGRSIGSSDGSGVGRWERGERLPRGQAALRYLALLDRLRKSEVSA